MGALLAARQAARRAAIERLVVCAPPQHPAHAISYPGA
jgi:hypothetical protein